MKVTDEMIEAFKNAKLCDCHPEDEIGTRLQKALDASDELQDLERFARAAAVSTTTDGTDEWNTLVDVWESLPKQMQNGLLT